MAINESTTAPTAIVVPAEPADFWPTYVLSRGGKMKGRVLSHTRRCTLEGCRGTRLGVRWKNGQLTYPCSEGLTSTKRADTWRIR